MFDWEAFLRTKRGTAIYHYRQRRLCPKCGKPVCDLSKSGLCATCVINEKRDHFNLKGNRYKTKQGYIRILINNEYVTEHRYIWETTHGQSVPKGWVIHHINGIKDDNRIENLHALPRSNHDGWTLLKVAQAKIRELEKNYNI